MKRILFVVNTKQLKSSHLCSFAIIRLLDCHFKIYIKYKNIDIKVSTHDAFLE